MRQSGRCRTLRGSAASYTMNKRLLLAGLSLALLTGCSTSSDGGSGFAVLSGSPLGGQVPSNNQASAVTRPPVLNDVALSVRVVVDGAAGLSGTESLFPAEAQRFQLQVLDAETEAVLAGPLLFDRSNLQQQVLGLSGRFFRVVVTALDETGNFLGVAERVLPAAAQSLELTIDSLVVPGPTREVGRLSVTRSAQDGGSNEPAISADGRFVVFSSVASTLTAITDTNGVRDIFVRDRVAGTTVAVTRGTVAFADGSVRFVSDGTSNTVSVGETGGEARDPDISADAGFIAYEQGTPSQIVVQARTLPFPTRVTPALVQLGVGQVNLSSGADPSLSGDGRFVAYVATLPGSPNQIALFDRISGTSLLVSKNSNGLAANGPCAHPVMSRDGSQLVFSSTATNLDAPGGLLVYDVGTGSTTRLGAPSSFPAAIAADNKTLVVNVDNRLRIIDRAANTNIELPELASFAVQGAPSMSADARSIVFYSPRAELVGNDGNGRTDVFSLDRQTGVISRVNVSGDGTAVAGGVDLSLSKGPVISGDGTRIAYATNDGLLVPNDVNSLDDVFSSANPTPGKLYIAVPGAIHRFDNVIAGTGPLTPAVTLSTPLLGAAPPDLYLDTANDRLYVASGDSSANRIAIYDKVSTLTSATHSRVSLFPSTQRGLFVDVAANLLYRGNSVYTGASTLASNTPARTASAFNPTSVYVDVRASRWLLGGPSRVEVLGAGTASITTVAPQRFAAPGAVFGIQPDLTPAGIPGQTSNRFVVLTEGGNPDPFHRLTSITQAPASTLVPPPEFNSTFGPNTGLGMKTLTSPPPGPFVTDAFTGQAFVLNGTDPQVLVFNQPTKRFGDVAPDRRLGLPVVPRGLALDRTR
jgi:Tol biopolymer transport system component